uniref:Uncharacterized protein n=1 Tax=Ciona savignyi TaxID=51511 RepID=H2ZJZ8_CIOSA
MQKRSDTRPLVQSIFHHCSFQNFILLCFATHHPLLLFLAFFGLSQM